MKPQQHNSYEAGMLSPILLGLVSIFLAALAQILLKQGLRLMTFERSMLMSPEGWLALVQNGWIPAGILCYVLSLVFWLDALSKGELSQLYLLSSLNFVILTAVGYTIFHENMELLRVAGLLLILMGVLLVIRS